MSKKVPKSQKLIWDADNKKNYLWQIRTVVVYYFAVVGIILAALFFVWSGNSRISSFLGVDKAILYGSTFKMLIYAFFGGALGSLLYNCRMLFHYYAKDKYPYNPKYFWKYIVSPLEGAFLSLVVIALLKSGMATFGGQSLTGQTEVSLSGTYAAFGIGVLTGTGARHSMKWLSGMARAMFRSHQLPDEGENLLTERVVKKASDKLLEVVMRYQEEGKTVKTEPKDEVVNLNRESQRNLSDPG